MAARRQSDRSDCLSRARGYPYDVTDHSYLFVAGKAAPADDLRPHCTGRVPVLAYGSNQSPTQLTRKFGHLAEEDAVIPVQRAWLANFDVVYSAHFTSYGAVPAMLQRAAGTKVALAVTWLNEHQLEIMHDTETSVANYAYRRLQRIDLALDDGTRLSTVDAYIGERGSLLQDGAPIPLAAVKAEGRRHVARSTADVLEFARARVAPDHEPDEFIIRLIDDARFRRDRSADIARQSQPFDWPHIRRR